jgi:integrase
MPFQVGNSPYYKVEITLPGYGKTPRLSTKTERKALANKMEDALRYVLEDGHRNLIEALEPEGPGQGGRIDLPTLYHAWRNRNLTELERRLDDPHLADAIRQYARTLDYDNHRRGARHILRMATEPGGPLLAGTDARLSWLYRPRHIDQLLHHMIHEDGYARNTVRNEPYGFISKFLRHRLGDADAQQILAEVDRPNEDDRREVWLTAEDVRRVVSASEWEVRMFLVLTASTGIDKSPALRIHHRDVDFEKWTLFVRDTKTEARKRTLQLAPVAVLALKLLLEDKEPAETAFDLSRGQLDYRWRKARQHAGLTPEGGFEDGVRLKDLRHTFAVHYMKSGGSIAGLQGRLGHSRGEQSMMYARHEVQETSDMQRAAQSMGLTLPKEIKSELPEPDEEEQTRDSIPAWWFDPDASPRLIDGDEEEILPVPDRKDEGPGGGGRRGLSPQQYRKAVQETGSISGAARHLEVSKTTVREQCIRHEIEVPTIGGVPGE